MRPDCPVQENSPPHREWDRHRLLAAGYARRRVAFLRLTPARVLAVPVEPARSAAEEARAHGARAASAGAEAGARGAPKIWLRHVRQVLAIEPARSHRHRAAGTDRKSTRLNSSHANISYAVFCLKKKK